MQIESPAHLYYLHVSSENPSKLAAFYRDQMAMEETVIDGTHVLQGGTRSIIVSPGPSGQLVHPAYALKGEAALAALRARLLENGVAMTPLDSPLYLHGAFLIHDPQGRQTAYGLPSHSFYADEEPARLQHAVFQTTELDSVVDFYVNKVGFTISDEVVNAEDGRIMVVFLRSDDEHHSLAFFRGSRNEWDHHCYETKEWNNIRDWGDKFAKLRIPIFFGPGRHGPGNNLFFMITDPDGNRLEISAEIDRVAPLASPGVWPHDEYTLNSWGRAWIRT
jgi:catechol 2,3-dioxygenase-like lactoylglutathione lyase family enzyme